MKHGISLIEIVMILAVIAVTLAVSVPAFDNLLSRHALVCVSHEFHGALRRCRQIAVTKNRYYGIKFIFVNGELLYGVFEDGDGDGLRTRDMEEGVDPMIKPYTTMQLAHGKIRPGLLHPDIPDIYDGGPIHNPNDPVKFGRGNICSFSPLGACTPGTLYLTDGVDLQAAVRIYGTTAMSRIMIYTEGRGWHRLRE